MRNARHTNGSNGFRMKGSGGFTLVELALVMIISGLMLSVIAAAYKAQLNSDQQEILYERSQEIQGALFEYLANAKRYPCPANPTLGPSDANYGKEDCAYKVVATTRDANNDGALDNVLIGSLPFEDMGAFLFNSELTAGDTIDPWGHKFLYAVTQNLTDAGKYNDFWGTIRVVDEYGNSIIQPTDSVHAVIISHGKNGKGSYTISGQAVENFNLLTPPGPPPPPGSITVSEIENGNDDGTFLAGLVNDSSLHYNDDYLYYIVNRSSDLWPIVGSNLDPVNTIYYVTNANPENVGVGIQNPGEKLDINGNLRAQRMRAEKICDTTGLDDLCMEVGVLAADDPDMNCPPGEAAISISNNKTQCVPLFNAATTDVSCPVGEYLNGFTNKGAVICIPFPP